MLELTVNRLHVCHNIQVEIIDRILGERRAVSAALCSHNFNECEVAVLVEGRLRCVLGKEPELAVLLDMLDVLMYFQRMGSLQEGVLYRDSMAFKRLGRWMDAVAAVLLRQGRAVEDVGTHMACHLAHSPFVMAETTSHYLQYPAAVSEVYIVV